MNAGKCAWWTRIFAGQVKHLRCGGSKEGGGDLQGVSFILMHKRAICHPVILRVKKSYLVNKT